MNNSKEVTVEPAQIKSIAKNLKALIESSRVPEIEIARALNTSVLTIRRIISGETEDPRISTLKALADYFKVSIDALLADNDQRSINSMINSKPRVIPILGWQIIEASESIQSINLNEWNDWYPVVGEQNYISASTFAIESRPSMQPQFPLGTLFIVNPDEAPRDSDIILIKMRQESALSLRELIIDPPKRQLQPIVTGSETLFYDAKKHEIIGVVVFTVLHKRKMDSMNAQ
ncbi:MAG: helix-turn-helix domain-containing protein [Bacteroidetes bacterium]|nr:helix-turn-helix domain-containing protein [Bacteroidota bacterium]